MCIVIFRIDPNNEFPFVLASNRDEFWSRPTAPLHWWDAGESKEIHDTVPTILAGQDFQEGGTWLAMQSHTHRLAVVTNYREPLPPLGQEPSLSRGKLVTDFLSSQTTTCIDDFIAHLEKESHLYSGFNLLFGSPTWGYYFYSNRTAASSSEANHPIKLETGQVYGMSNGFLNEPWPKVSRGKEAFSKALEETMSGANESERPRKESLKQKLWNVMADEWKPEEKDLPKTGVTLEFEKILSSIFVQGAAQFNYGTRCSTIILQTSDGTWEVEERTYHRPNMGGEDEKGLLMQSEECETRLFRL